MPWGEGPIREKPSGGSASTRPFMKVPMAAERGVRRAGSCGSGS